MSKDEVDAWFEEYENPQKEVMQTVRRMILAADDRIEECIKWKSPTFTFSGNIASFNPRSKKHASLMFHTGAEIPGDFPHMQGGNRTARYMTFESKEEAESLRRELESVVQAWCKLKAGSTTKKPH